ncbi:MAG: restriction endonuclease subunit S [Methanobacterium formicicum]
MKLKPYPEYNDSGVEWMGQIPLKWYVKKFKHELSLLDHKRIPLSGEVRADMENKIYDYYGASGVIDKVERYIFNGKYILLGEDGANLLLRSTALAFIAEGKFWVNNHAHIIEPKDGNIDYFVNLLESIDYTPLIEGSAQPKLTADNLKNFELIVPPVSEQQLMASFLNKKTSEIDLTIEKDTSLIELLKEKRTALINHVVTKGLNPTVKMKDSGVEWIGEIPEDWAMIKIKHLAGNCSNPVQTGPFGAQLHAEDYVETGIPLILIRNVNNGQINIKNIPFVSEEDAIRLSMYRLNVGDIVFSRVGSLGRAALVTKNEESWLISGQMLRLRLQDKRINAPYLVYVFQSDLSNEYVSLESVGSTRESLNTEILSNLPFPLPSIEKQDDLVEYLNNETSQIDLIIQKVENKISYLEEYKKSLIHHVVTGKVDVREVAV